MQYQEQLPKNNVASDCINVVGWYNKKNCGDESYKEAFRKVFPNRNFVFSTTPINDASAYIIGGGDVLTEDLLKRFASIDKPKHIMSVTISKEFDKSLFDNFKTIIVRDLESQSKLHKIGIESALYPDFAFSLTYNRDNGKRLIQDLFQKENRDCYEKIVAIIINGHLLPPRECSLVTKTKFDNFLYEVALALDNVAASFLFIPFGTKEPWDDRVCNSMVGSKCKYWKKNLISYNEYSVQDTIDIISACDGVISTRLHSSIFSVLCEVPFVDITHNHKNKAFLQTIGQSQKSIEYSETTINSLTNAINTCLERKDDETKNLVCSYKNRLDSLSNIRLT